VTALNKTACLLFQSRNTIIFFRVRRTLQFAHSSVIKQVKESVVGCCAVASTGSTGNVKLVNLPWASRSVKLLLLLLLSFCILLYHFVSCVCVRLYVCNFFGRGAQGDLSRGQQERDGWCWWRLERRRGAMTHRSHARAKLHPPFELLLLLLSFKRRAQQFSVVAVIDHLCSN